MMTSCEVCDTEYEEGEPDTLDFRFDYPVCITCVEDYALEPEEG
jgi:hypothetical protein